MIHEFLLDYEGGRPMRDEGLFKLHQQRDECKRNLKAARETGDAHHALCLDGDLRVLEASIRDHEAIYRTTPPRAILGWHPVQGDGRLPFALFAMRECEGLRQSHLAKRMDVAQSTIARLESSEVYPHRVARVRDWAGECGYEPLTVFVRQPGDDLASVVTRLAIEMGALKNAYEGTVDELLDVFFARLALLTGAASTTCYVLTEDDCIELIASIGLRNADAFRCTSRGAFTLPCQLMWEQSPGYFANINEAVTDLGEVEFLAHESIFSSVYVPLTLGSRNAVIFLNYNQTRSLEFRQETVEALAGLGPILTFLLAERWEDSPSTWHGMVVAELRQLAKRLRIHRLTLCLEAETEPRSVAGCLLPNHSNGDRGERLVALESDGHRVGTLSLQWPRSGTSDATIQDVFEDPTGAAVSHLAYCCTPQFRGAFPTANCVP